MPTMYSLAASEYFKDDVRLEILTELTVAVLAYLRTDDGTLAVLHDEVSARTTESGGYEYRVPVFNPAHSMAQASRLRLINPSGNAAMVSIQGRDDAGTAAIGGTLSLMLSAGGARTLTAQQLEAGGAGLTGQLGAGMGRWRLLVSSDRAIRVVNLVSSSTGRLDNLSSSGIDGLAPGDHAVFGQRFVARGDRDPLRGPAGHAQHPGRRHVHRDGGVRGDG